MNNYYKALNEIASIFDLDQWDNQVNLFTNSIKEQLDYFIYRIPQEIGGNEVKILGGGSHCSFYGGYGKIYIENKQINSDTLVYNGYIDVSEYRKKGLKKIYVIIKDLSETIATHHPFFGCTGMFNDCICLIKVPWFDTSGVTRMHNMFQNCSSLINVPLLDTSNVTDMSYMFYNCPSLSKETKEIWGEIYDFNTHDRKKK